MRELPKVGIAMAVLGKEEGLIIARLGPMAPKFGLGFLWTGLDYR